MILISSLIALSWPIIVLLRLSSIVFILFTESDNTSYIGIEQRLLITLAISFIDTSLLLVVVSSKLFNLFNTSFSF